MWTPALLAFVAFLTVDLTQAQVCGNVTVWRNNNQTCPPRAICADVFDTIRDWFNGTTCPEKRTLHNCICQSGAACPINDPAHELFASSYHKIYTCEPKCQFEYCSDLAPTSSNGPVAMTTEQQSPEFNGLTFNRIECRCPRHHNPSSGYGTMHFSVKSVGTTYVSRTRNYQTRQVCRNSGSDSQLEDPCDS